MKRAGIRYVPGCVELADKDPTSTAIAVNLGVTDAVPPGALSYTYRSYFEELQPYLQDGKRRTYTPYEVRNVEAMVRLGMRREALQLLRYLVRDAVFPPEWNHMAEVVHARRRAPSYIGDMPHTWVGSDYINAVRSIFSFVQDDTLVLAAGVDPAWLAQGVTVKRLPTQYGQIDYTMKKLGDHIIFEASGNLSPPNGFELPLPREFQGMTATMNGNPAVIKDGAIHFDTLPVKIELR